MFDADYLLQIRKKKEKLARSCSRQFKGNVASIVTFGAICSANNSYLAYLVNSVARCSRVQIIVLKVHPTAQIRPADGAAMTAASQMAFTVRYDDEAHRKLRSICGEASRPPTA